MNERKNLVFDETRSLNILRRDAMEYIAEEVLYYLEDAFVTELEQEDLFYSFLQSIKELYYAEDFDCAIKYIAFMAKLVEDESAEPMCQMYLLSFMDDESLKCFVGAFAGHIHDIVQVDHDEAM